MELSDLLEYVQSMTGGLRGKAQAAGTAAITQPAASAMGGLAQRADRDTARQAAYDDAQASGQEARNSLADQHWQEFMQKLRRPLSEQLGNPPAAPNGLRRAVNGAPVSTGYDGHLEQGVMAVRN